jgi:hypothetical protein
MVTPALRAWFVVHFVIDVLFAVPLLVAPEWFGGMIGWPRIDPLTARLVGAALLAIGVESWLGRNAGLDAYRAMLTLKVIWAWSAVAGIVVTMVSVPDGPLLGWVFAAVFAAFGAVWTYYRRRLGAA